MISDLGLAIRGSGRIPAFKCQEGARGRSAFYLFEPVRTSQLDGKVYSGIVSLTPGMPRAWNYLMGALGRTIPAILVKILHLVQIGPGIELDFVQSWSGWLVIIKFDPLPFLKLGKYFLNIVLCGQYSKSVQLLRFVRS